MTLGTFPALHKSVNYYYYFKIHQGVSHWEISMNVFYLHRSMAEFITLLGQALDMDWTVVGKVSSHS